MKPVLLFIPLWVTVTAQVQVLPTQRSGVPPQVQTGKASIEGTVLDAITREPVKKASVMLISRLGLSAVTDASGHFAFRQLPAGPYGLQARADKYPAMPQVSISLAADEQKQDVTVLLTPGASVRGRIVDEDGSPMRCGVLSMQFRDTGTGRTLQQSGFSQSDEKGEYRISNLPRGKYYIQVRCNQSVPLPHAFIRRTTTADLPTLTYPPVFYPTASEPMSAAKVDASPGADISGIDFRMIPARGVTVRGHVGSAPDRNIQLTLVPKDSLGRDWQKRGEPVNPSTGEFRIPGVLPGSYDLLAATWGDGPSYFAKVSVEVGGTPSEPIDLTLAAAPAISGTISFEGDTKVPMNSLRLMMNPLEGGPVMGPPQQAEVQSDGTFILNSVMPGHWRLNLNGGPGYIKSVQQGDREVPAWDLEIGASPVQLKIVVSSKFAQVEATLAATPAGSEPLSGILWSASGDPQFQHNVALNPQGLANVSIPPGKYHICAFATAQPWVIMQNRALRKALESHCETVEASEDGSARVQIPLIPEADLKQLLEKIEE